MVATVAVVACLAVVAVGCSGGKPYVDEAFYRQTYTLDPTEHGRLLASQRPDGELDSYRTWRILYQSIDATGKPVTVSGMALRPNKAAPAGGWPLIAFAHGTTGLSDGCAPSRDPSSVGLVQDLLAGGYAVVETDYVGLGTPGVHPYLDGASEGHAVLDSIRAAHSLRGLQTGPTTILWGYSQGGHAALFASQQAVADGIDLGIAGVIDMAGPATKQWTLDAAGDSPRFQFFLLTAIAAAKTRAGLSMPDVLGAGSIAAAPELLGEDSKDCPDLTEIANGVPADQRVTNPAAAIPAWSAAFDATDLPGAGAVAPVYIQHGTADPTVPYTESLAARARLCAGGTSVTLNSQQGGNHLTAVDPKPPLEWLKLLLGGVTPRNDCPR